MKGLTHRQETVLEIISRWIREQGYPPTLQELADTLGASSRNTAVKHLSALVKKGYIAWEKNTARGIRLLEARGFMDREDEVSLPLVGAVPAGAPLLAEENVERYVTVPHSLMRSGGPFFVLRVRGESMRNAGVLNDDLVIVRSQYTADTGDIVVALIDGEATVKRLALQGDRQYLKAENPEYDNIFPESEWSVQGKVVALVREEVV